MLTYPDTDGCLDYILYPHHHHITTITSSPLSLHPSPITSSHCHLSPTVISPHCHLIPTVASSPLSPHPTVTSPPLSPYPHCHLIPTVTPHYRLLTLLPRQDIRRGSPGSRLTQLQFCWLTERGQNWPLKSVS